MQRFAILGAVIWLIFLGIISIVEIIMAIISKTPASRTQYLSGFIFFALFGLIYYLAFRVLGGSKSATWDGTESGKKILLFIMGLPGLVIGFVVLIFVIWFWLSEDADRVGYSLNKKKKKKDSDVNASPTSVETDKAI